MQLGRPLPGYVITEKPENPWKRLLPQQPAGPEKAPAPVREPEKVPA